MATLQLTAAVSDYDHVCDLLLEDVRVEGIDLTLLRFSVNEIFHRFTATREWDISERERRYSATSRTGPTALNPTVRLWRPF